MEIRAATGSDASQIMAIYNEAVTSSLVTFDIAPRKIDEQQEWIQDHGGSYPALVAVEGSRTIGFGALSPYRDRAGYRTTVEDSVYIATENRRRGAGRGLLEALVAHATASGFHAVIARMHSLNEASIGLHRSVGFFDVGTEREVGRKFGKWLDAVVMELILA